MTEGEAWSLALENLGLIEKTIKISKASGRYRSFGDELWDELRSRGPERLLSAAQTYDEKKGDFKAYAAQALRNELTDAVRRLRRQRGPRTLGGERAEGAVRELEERAARTGQDFQLEAVVSDEPSDAPLDGSLVAIGTCHQCRTRLPQGDGTRSTAPTTAAGKRTTRVSLIVQGGPKQRQTSRQQDRSRSGGRMEAAKSSRPIRSRTTSGPVGSARSASWVTGYRQDGTTYLEPAGRLSGGDGGIDATVPGLQKV